MFVKTQRLKVAVTLLFLLGLPVGLVRAQKDAASPVREAPPERFDHLVRRDFFAGYAGDVEALKRGMVQCEERLKTDPNNAEALVWHGGGLLFGAGKLFADKEWQRGAEQQQRGLAEMDRAVVLRPKDIGILVPRAAMLVTYSRFVPNAEQRAAMLARVVSDYEEVYLQQKPYIDKLSSHSRNELIFGLAEAYLRTGGDENRAKAHALLKLSLTNGDYSKEADAWLKAPAEAKAATFAHRCIGCHV
ncbi:MAG: hypothetical protein KA368_17925 [Acidobacteria bacterium]|nr:hypothetical protein [Acidobacteriota bacterium]